MIIDDLFSDAGGEPQRAVAFDGPWLRGLLKRLAPAGVLVCNFGSPQELSECAWFRQPAVATRLVTAFQLTTPRYENAIGAFVCQPVTSAALRERLRGEPGLNPDHKGCRLDYRIRRLHRA
jgi:hypothetical protein